MAVFHVAATYKPNGVRKSRPIVADDGEEARQIAEVEWNINENDPDFSWEIAARPDPDGNYERLLIDAEQRRLRAEMWR
jgi:hypothetical protein